MKFQSFHITNFKGIKSLTLDFGNNPKSAIHTLIGLNESGKTSILEAINFFNAEDGVSLPEIYKTGVREKDRANILVPISKKANFNGKITVSATILLEQTDKDAIVTYAKRHLYFDINPSSLKDSFSIDRIYEYESSVFKKSSTTWNIRFDGRVPKAKIDRSLYDVDKEKWNLLVKFIRTQLPNISYYPTFLFEFPEKIYLNRTPQDDKVNAYYKNIVQEILDSLGQDLEIGKHLVLRANTLGLGSHNLRAVLTQMSGKVTQEVFSGWNQIFGRQIQGKSFSIEIGEEPVDTPPKEDASETEKLDKRYYLQFFLNDNNNPYLVTDRSLGFRWFFCFLLFTMFRGEKKESSKQTIFLFDEPASNLHSTAQTQLLNSLQKLADKNNIIVYSTHSRYLINPKWLENAFVVTNAALKYQDSDIYTYLPRDTDIGIQRYRDFVAQNGANMSYFQPVLDVLEYVPCELDHIPSTIIVEGKNDYYTYKYMYNNLIRESKKKLSLHFTPALGASSFDSIISLYLGWGRDFVALLDGDKEGSDQKSRYKNDYCLPDDKVYTLQDINAEWKKVAVEKLFSQQDYESLCTSMGYKTDKKSFVRAVQEKLAAGQSYSFSTETLNNFIQVFDFLEKRMKLV